jgi:hypothetical protein
MLSLVKNIFGRPKPRRTLRAVHVPLHVRGRYDAATTTEENRRHWANADLLSADAANNPRVRTILRSRARYEVANNSYTALFISEEPEVRFNDVFTVTLPQVKSHRMVIDPKHLEVCEPRSIEVLCGTDLPIAVGSAVEGDCIHFRFARQNLRKKVRVTVRLTGIRKGFGGVRFPDRGRKGGILLFLGNTWLTTM